jgi:hypothetical protein
MKLTQTLAWNIVLIMAHYSLKPKVANSDDVNIGFRYNNHKDGRVQRSLIPVESRFIIAIEFSVIETASENVIQPVQLTEHVDLDTIIMLKQSSGQQSEC